MICLPGLPVRVHFAFFVLAAAFVLLGRAAALLAGLCALLLHEAGHVAAARLCGAALGPVELTPFGGMAAYDGAQTTPHREALVALGGPLCSLLGAFLGAALGGRFPFAALFARMSAVLLVLNLLPALPLDGGRALRALLYPRLGRARVTGWLCGAGAAAGAGLSLLGGYAAWRGRLNPLLFLCGAYLLRQALLERETSALLCARALHGRGEWVRKGGARPVRVFAARADTPPRLLAARLTGGEYCVFLLLDGVAGVKETVSETEVLRRWMGE